VHVLIRAYQGAPLGKIVQSWESFTGSRIRGMMQGAELGLGDPSRCGPGPSWRSAIPARGAGPSWGSAIPAGVERGRAKARRSQQVERGRAGARRSQPVERGRAGARRSQRVWSRAELGLGDPSGCGAGPSWGSAIPGTVPGAMREFVLPVSDSVMLSGQGLCHHIDYAQDSGTIKVHPRKGKAGLPFGEVTLPFCMQGAGVQTHFGTHLSLLADMG